MKKQNPVIPVPPVPPVKEGFLSKLKRIFFFDENGNPSSRKIYAFIFCWLAIADIIVVNFFTEYHYSARLTLLKVDASVIITIITLQNLLAVSALTIYGFSVVKKEG